MAEEVAGLSRRFDALAEQVRQLQQQVDALARQVSELSHLPTAAFLETPTLERTFGNAVPTSGEEGEAVSTANLLSNLAALCFVLVVALVLRMLADHEIVDRRIGAALGLAYATALIAYGFHRYSISRRLLPIYALSGVFLICSIVYEVHVRFALLPSMPAHGLLALAMLAVAVMAWRFDISLPLYAGVLGCGATGMMLGFPNLHFLHTGVLLVLANLLAYSGVRVRHGRPLFWLSLTLTVVFWALWAIKLRTPFSRGELLTENLSPTWFLPLLGIYVAMYVVFVLWSVRTDGWDHVSLEGALPIVNVLFAYAVALAAGEATGVGLETIAAAGSFLAVAHVLLAVAVARRKGSTRKPTTTFTIAAVVLLGAALPGAIERVPLVLLLWTTVAFGIGIISFVRENRLARATAYLFQVFVCLFAAKEKVFAVAETASPGAALLALALMGLCLGHYAWCRTRAAQPETIFFRCAAILLALTAASYGFAFARLVLAHVMEGAGFHAAQSVVINVGALILLLAGLHRNNGEVLAAGFVAVFFGAVKVFAFDLTHLKDVPLVLSLSVFGLTAAASSLLWRHWQRRNGPLVSSETAPLQGRIPEQPSQRL